MYAAAVITPKHFTAAGTLKRKIIQFLRGATDMEGQKLLANQLVHPTDLLCSTRLLKQLPLRTGAGASPAHQSPTMLQSAAGAAGTGSGEAAGSGVAGSGCTTA